MVLAAQQKTSIAHLKSDPLRNFKFYVNIHHMGGMASMGFMSVGGLNMTTEVIPYRQGGMNTTTQKLPGQTDFAPVTLTTGLVVGPQYIMSWMKELFAVIQGTGTGPAGHDFRQNFEIQVLDHPVTRGPVPVKARFKVFNAWPTSVAWSDLDAGANAIIVQQMVLAHEGFDMKVAHNIGRSAAPNF